MVFVRTDCGSWVFRPAGATEREEIERDMDLFFNGPSENSFVYCAAHNISYKTNGSYPPLHNFMMASLRGYGPPAMCKEQREMYVRMLTEIYQEEAKMHKKRNEELQTCIDLVLTHPVVE